MPRFSKKSLDRLETCSPGIQKVMKEVIIHYDISILDGYRNEERQSDAFVKGHSNRKFPFSVHNHVPSKAVDIAPYPIDFDDVERFKEMAAFVLETAMRLGVRMKWGGNWVIRGVSSLFDAVHFEEY